jgi:hypothetical protein
MNHIKDFLKFINENNGAHELSRLGLMSKNAAFIRDITKIIELCPNLKYITYPSGLIGSRSVPMEEEGELFFKLVWRRLISIGAMTPDLKARLTKLSNDDRYDERDALIMQTGLEEFTEEEIEDLKLEASQAKENGIKDMIDELNRLDATEDHVLKLWDISAQRTAKQEYIAIPKRSYQDYDTREVLKFLTENPEYGQRITTLQIAATSDASNRLGDRLSSGEYGPLD